MRSSLPAGRTLSLESGQFVAEMDRILGFFSTQVEMNLNLNGGRLDRSLHQKAERRAVRSILTAVTAFDSARTSGRSD